MLKHRREIDGLRALAVLPVIFFHAGFDFFGGGFVGVDIFFVISGYLITSIIVTQRRAGTFSLLKFYERRARRILPALFLVVAACIPFAWALLTPSHMREFTASVRYLAVFVSNLYFYKESGYFGPEAELEPLLHTWSLSVEEQYYVLYPVMLLLLFKLAFAPRFLAVVLTGVAVGSLGFANYEIVRDPYAAFFLLPGRVWELMLGGLLAWLVVGGTLKVKANQSASLLGLGLILYSVLFFTDNTPTPSVYTLIPTLGAALIILCATPGTYVGILLSTGPLVGIGLISYSAYLWHQPIFAFARHWNLADPTPKVMIALIALSLMLSWLSWRYVEQPCRRGDWINQKRVFAIAGAMTALFFSFGMMGKATDGYAFRFPVDEKLDRELRQISKERDALIKANICHFNDSTKVGVEGFLAQWHCDAKDGGEEEIPVPLIVTGDSHSADIAMALRLNGLSPLQLGGAGCSLIPSKMTRDCRLIFDELYVQVKDDSTYEYLALANAFSEDELTVYALDEMLSYWEGFGKKLIFFVGMPNFPYFKERLTYGEQPIFDHKLSELSKKPEFLQRLRDRGVYIVDREKIFCALNGCSYLAADGGLLLSGKAHLSKQGALLFGRELLARDPLFKQLLSVAKQN